MKKAVYDILLYHNTLLLSAYVVGYIMHICKLYPQIGVYVCTYVCRHTHYIVYTVCMHNTVYLCSILLTTEQ